MDVFLLALPVPCQRGAVFPGSAGAKLAVMLLLFLIVVIKPELFIDSVFSSATKILLTFAALPSLQFFTSAQVGIVGVSLFMHPRASVQV